MIRAVTLATPAPKPSPHRRFPFEIDIELEEIALRRVLGAKGAVDVGGYASAIVCVGYDDDARWDIVSIHLTGRERISAAVLNDDFTLETPAHYRDVRVSLEHTDPLYSALCDAIRANHAQVIDDAVCDDICERRDSESDTRADWLRDQRREA